MSKLKTQESHIMMPSFKRLHGRALVATAPVYCSGPAASSTIKMASSSASWTTYLWRIILSVLAPSTALLQFGSWAASVWWSPVPELHLQPHHQAQQPLQSGVPFPIRGDSDFYCFSPNLPNITIYATGGTIAGSASSADQITGYQAGALGVQALIDAVPQLCNTVNVRGVQFTNTDSRRSWGSSTQTQTEDLPPQKDKPAAKSESRETPLRNAARGDSSVQNLVYRNDGRRHGSGAVPYISRDHIEVKSDSSGSTSINSGSQGTLTTGDTATTESIRTIFLATSVLERSAGNPDESRHTKIEGAKFTLEDLEATRATESPSIWNLIKKIPAFCHWGILVAPEDNLAHGYLFEIGVERKSIFPKRHPGACMKQEVMGKLKWKLTPIGYTALSYEMIETLAKEVPHKTGEIYDFPFRNCQLFSYILYYLIFLPRNDYQLYEGLDAIPGERIRSTILQRLQQFEAWQSWSPTSRGPISTMPKRFAEICLITIRFGLAISLASAYGIFRVQGRSWSFIFWCCLICCLITALLAAKILGSASDKS
ncbi:hypothetical protein FOVG_01381 [Fusarium oxysporum f. sp. pisi HDV247]|uniref:L-asparaginase N-terminal domain-containing protein n=1 Tax=Fusarium oxysporum f. sp. pisi HDV247 TaxID=1080344 RepID=W9QRW6_FUSOX|nr:hypothetical protein FOVG_01381 [Fusarium oxysporum f. sp. pisi HDV247]